MNARNFALDVLARCLRVCSVSGADSTLNAVIGSGHLDWRVLLDLADVHLVTPALWAAIREKGFGLEVPPSVREHLWKIHLLSTHRNFRLREQAISAVRVLNSIGIEPVLLKGGASLFDNTFGDLGSRVMADLDMLVPREHAYRCWKILRANGYMPIGGNYDYYRHHHLRPLLLPGSQSTIEIHREVLPSSAAAILPTGLVWKCAQPVNESDAVFCVPDPTHRILHNVIHAALINRGYARGDISLRSLHELALIQSQHEKQIDWTEIQTLMCRGGKSRVLNAWLYATHRLFGISFPDGLRPTHRAILHYVRTRLQVRWGWIEEIIDKVIWFSARDICERYQCNEDFVSVARGRMRLAASLLQSGGVKLFRYGCRSSDTFRSA